MIEKEAGTLRFYGRRKGKPLRATKTDAYDSVLPSVVITDPALLTFQKTTWLEIGFGDGKHLAWQAAQHPDVNMIGCEPFLNGIAALCADIKQEGLKNIRIWPDDARLLMRELPDNSLDRCFLLNSDPWPKTRHHKRRFIQKETLDELHRILKTGAELLMSTDHQDLAVWELYHAYTHGGFEWNIKDMQGWMRPC